MAQYRSLNVRSPFFTQLSTTQILVNCEVRLWKGDVVNDLPVDYTYLLTKEPTSGASTFEVAELARDFLAHNSSLTSGYCWMQTKLIDGDQLDVVTTYLITEGYTLYTEGLQSNAQTPIYDFVGLPIDDANSKRRIMVTESGTNVIPYYSSSDGINYSTEAYNLSNVSLGNTLIPVKTNSNQMIRNFIVTPSMSSVFFDFDGNGQTVMVDVLRCSKYEAINLMYVNKSGMKTYFPFILKSIEQIKSSSDTFDRSLVNYNALSSNSGLHASRKRITGTKQSFVLNTDWISEYYVKQLEELLLSEYVWLVKGVDNPIPVNVTTSTMEKKTHINDKLINYSIELETASNYINTVR
tara:strand:- start:2222 stop:3277 length:1056 start_codon:yes stop_codon:yes gene_type:complete